MFQQEMRHNIRQLPMPLMLQSLSLLSMDHEALEEYLRNAVLSNPLLEYPERKSAEDHQSYIYSLPEKNRGLYPALVHQLHTSIGLSRRITEAAEYLIGCLDDDGYLRTPLEELAAESCFPSELLHKALNIVQALDPAGVGARSLRECLLLQLDRLEGDTVCAKEIVLNQLERLPDNVSMAEGYTAEQVCAAIEQIRTLSPRPGLAFAADDMPPTAIPEIEVRMDAAGELELRPIFSAEYPRFNELYHSTYLNIRDPETALYIRRQAEAARRLIRAVQRRSDTLLAICYCIVRRQHDFFTRSACLNPLRISDVARQLSMNSSTISRGINGKYLLFRGQVYPLRSFFCTALSSGHSSNQVKARIAELLASPHAGHISDQEIANQLSLSGISISRRTVNKYRQEILCKRR